MIRQPHVASRLLLRRAECMPSEVTVEELSDALAAAVEGGRAVLARRVCVVGVRHAAAAQDSVAAASFITAGNIISAARRHAKHESSPRVPVPQHALFGGSVGDVATSATRGVRSTFLCIVLPAPCL